MSWIGSGCPFGSVGGCQQGREGYRPLRSTYCVDYEEYMVDEELQISWRVKALEVWRCGSVDLWELQKFGSFRYRRNRKERRFARNLI